MKQPTKYFSAIHESVVSKFLGWSVVTGSGSRSCFPGDIISSEWLGECKTHTSPGHSILFDSSVWKKITEEAASKHRYPALFVDDGSQSIKCTWCLLPRFTLDEWSDNIKFTPYPNKFDKHINFKHDELKAIYDEQSSDAEALCFTVKFNTSDLVILPLEVFGDILNS